METYPNVGVAWEEMSKYPERRNLIAVTQPWVSAAFAVQWEGEDEPQGWGLPNFKRVYKNDPFDDSALLERMYDILEEADLVTGHNIDAFDIRKINARIWKAGLPPPLPTMTFDTLKLARKKFLLPSYSLKSIAEYLGCPFSKLQHEGIDMWLKCMAGDPVAWEQFIAYNKQDVRVSAWIYPRIRAWSSTHPNITLLGDQDNLCPVCGYKTRFLPDSPGLRKSFLVERWRCQRKSCGKTSFGKRIKPNAEVLTA